MATCLVTTLKEAADNNDLLKVGEMRFHVTASSVTKIRFGIVQDKSLTLTIEGNGHFTDSTGTQNYGSSVTQARGSSVFNVWYVPAGEYDIVADNKYVINRVDCIGLSSGSNIIIPIEELGYSPLVFILYKKAFDLKDIKNCVQMESMYLGGECKGELTDILPFSSISTLSVDDCKLRGNLSSLSSLNFKSLSLYDSSVVYGDFGVIASMSNLQEMVTNRCPNVTGNLSAFSGKTSMTVLGVASTKATGNISSLAGLTNLITLNVSNTAITGDTSSLANLTNLTTFTYTNTAITGTWPLT